LAVATLESFPLFTAKVSLKLQNLRRDQDYGLLGSDFVLFGR